METRIVNSVQTLGGEAMSAFRLKRVHAEQSYAFGVKVWEEKEDEEDREKRS